MAKDNIELLLSILIAISVGFALEKLVDVSDTGEWFFLSGVSILVSVVFIYMMLEINPKSITEVSKLFVLGSVLFLPFTLSRLSRDQNSASAGFVWGPGLEYCYIFLISAFFIWWGICERINGKEKGKYIIGFGIILGLGAAGVWII